MWTSGEGQHYRNFASIRVHGTNRDKETFSTVIKLFQPVLDYLRNLPPGIYLIDLLDPSAPNNF